MIHFYETPKLVQAWYSNFIWKVKSENSIYLTFDDGPHPEITPWILNQLDKFDAKASFFCLGKNVRDYPELVKNFVRAGHQIGNHTYLHSNGWKTSRSVYFDDIKKCDEALDEIGIQTTLFRPPYGRIRKSQAKEIINKKIIMWSHSAYDFDANLNLDASLRKLKRAKPGSIIVFHDNQKAFKNLKELLPRLLSHYTSRGYNFDLIP